MITTMLRTTKFTLIGLTLALGVAGCVGRTPKPVVQPQPTPVSAASPTPSPTVSATPKETAVETIISDIATSDWPTYRSEEYGFEVKYPEGWSVWKVPIGSQISFSPWKPHGDAPMVYVNTYNDTGGSEDYNVRVENEVSRWNLINRKKQETTLLDHKVIQYRSTSKNNLERITFLTGEKFIYGISFMPAGEIPLEIYNAMLLTFRAINTN